MKWKFNSMKDIHFQAEGDWTDEVLPNGYTRGEYYIQGYSDSDIEYWGLNQSGAPSPEAAGRVFMLGLIIWRY